MLTPPLFMLLFGLLLAAGALIAACFQSWSLVIGPSLMGVIFVLLKIRAAGVGSRSSAVGDHVSSGSYPYDTDADVGASSLLSKQRVAEAAIVVLVAFAPTFGYLYANWRMPVNASSDISALAGRVVELAATVDSCLPQNGGAHARFVCSASRFHRFARFSLWRSCTGTTLVMLPVGSDAIKQIRSQIKFKCTGRVISLADLERRNRSGYANYLRRSGISSLFIANAHQAQTIVILPNSENHDPGWKNTADSIIDSGRRKVIQAHAANLGRKVGCLLTAMVLGEKAVGLDSNLLTEFRSVGLSHVLAASGFNLTIVVVSVNWLCRLLSFPSIAANCLSFSLMAVFVLFAGNSASVVRAALMCGLAIAAKCFGHRVNAAGLIGGALTLSILSDPLSVADPGFQLSYAAVSAVIFIVGPVVVFLENSIARRWLRWLLTAIVTVFIAQASVLPLQLYYFKQIGMLFLPANLLASLVVTPITVAGFVSSMLLLLNPGFDPLGKIFSYSALLLDWLAALPLYLLVESVALLSGCRWAVLKFPPLPVWQVLLYYLIFVLAAAKLLASMQRRGLKNEPGNGEQFEELH